MPNPSSEPITVPFAELGEKAYTVNRNNGWDVFTPQDWGNDVSVLKLCANIALVHREIAEADEAVSANDIVELREEIADVAIRTASIAHGLGIDIDFNVKSYREELQIPFHELDIMRGLMELHKVTSHATEAVRSKDAGKLVASLMGILLHSAAISQTIGSNLAAEMEKKIEKNASRGHKHGGKAI